jgi:MOSC domain-containing protein YiiM
MGMEMTGRLLGIAVAPGKRKPLILVPQAAVSETTGVEGEARITTAGRRVTVLFREGWEAACAELGVDLPWTTRRANLLVEGMPVPQEGARFAIGPVVLEVTEETKPCSVMEAAHRGLRAALKPAWRGGVCCRVIAGGTIRPGDAAAILS